MACKAWATNTPTPSSERLEFPHPMITRKQLSNTDNNVCLAPWPWSSPISRIFHRRYFIYTRGSFLADADQAPEAGQATRGMVASAGSGLSIVEWKMRQGEEVIFRYKDFHGASENVLFMSPDGSMREWQAKLGSWCSAPSAAPPRTAPEPRGRRGSAAPRAG